MPLFAESEEKIFGEIIVDIVNNSSITRSSNGAKMRAVAEALSKKLGRMWAKFDLNVGIPFIDGANGRYLDFIGGMLGLPRLGEEPASISSFDTNVRFYVNVGTFGLINGGSSITIPEGTILSTGPDGTGTKYRVTVNTVLLSSASETYISVRSVSTGDVVNIGARKLTYHNFISYSDVVNNSLLVTNDSEISLGQNVEGDANYRYRIVNQIVASEKANRTAIRLAALMVPGVADVTVIPYFRGIGSYDILIKSVTPTVPQSLINIVSSEVLKVTSEGIVGRVRGPVEVGVSIVGSLVLKKVISAEERTNLVETVTFNVTDYINGLDIAESMIINELIERVMVTSDVIKTVGTPGQPFDKIFKYTPSKLQDNKVRSTVIADITAKTDHRLIVENVYAGETPILFRIV